MLTAEEMFPEKARHRELVGLLTQIRDRLPDPDADTVTLRRDDAERIYAYWDEANDRGVTRRVRAALGWEQ